MINETLLVKQYLNGENINEGIMYRICYLLSKWYKENGINSKLEIRNNIFKTSNTIKILYHLSCSWNSMPKSPNKVQAYPTDNFSRV